jgi:hypothetical protein
MKIVFVIPNLMCYEFLLLAKKIPQSSVFLSLTVINIHNNKIYYLSL